MAVSVVPEGSMHRLDMSMLPSSSWHTRKLFMAMINRVHHRMHCPKPISSWEPGRKKELGLACATFPQPLKRKYSLKHR
jgi:hypothetical protein